MEARARRDRLSSRSIAVSKRNGVEIVCDDDVDGVGGVDGDDETNSVLRRRHSSPRPLPPDRRIDFDQVRRSFLLLLLRRRRLPVRPGVDHHFDRIEILLLLLLPMAIDVDLVTRFSSFSLDVRRRRIWPIDWRNFFVSSFARPSNIKFRREFRPVDLFLRLDRRHRRFPNCKLRC